MAHDINALLREMAELEASDLLLKVGTPPSYRIAGKVHILKNHPPLTEDDQKAIYDTITTPRAKRIFDERNECDIAYEVQGCGRYRGNIFRQRGYIGVVFRHIKSKVPTLEELGLPAETLKRLSLKPRGLLLVTGVAGSGKSTTIASMLEYLNRNSERHVITIEDPIEYTFQDDRCVIEQREIGQDTDSFTAAIKSAVRQSPDILMIGEMRDRETMEAALNAAETGHLIFSTLHSANAMQTVDRIVNMFEPHEHQFLKLQMSLLLEGVISQRLLPRIDGNGRVPAIEIMLGTPRVRELLMQGKTRDLYQSIKESGIFGCMTFNQSLKILLDQNLIDLEEALRAADSPDELKLELRGITKEAGKARVTDSTANLKRPSVF